MVGDRILEQHEVYYKIKVRMVRKERVSRKVEVRMVGKDGVYSIAAW